MGEQPTALRATAHPVRIRMLSLLTNTAMSASELARELGITTANASYHLRFLARAGLVDEAGTEQIRGGRAIRYTHPWDAPQSREQTAPDDRARFLRILAEELVRRGSLPREPGTEGNSTDADLWVTPEIADAVLARVVEASELIHSHAQPPRTPGTVHVSLTAAYFRIAGDGQAEDS